MDYTPPVAIEFNIATQGLDKGLLEENGAQVVGGVRVDLSKNLYVRGSAKNVDGLSAGEADAAIGLTTSVADVALTGEVAYKRMIDPVRGADNEAVEFNASATKLLGPVGTTVAVSYSPNALGLVREALYVEGTARVAFTGNVNLVGSLGHAERDGGNDYTAYSGGMEYRLGNATASVRYYDTARDELGRTYSDRVVGSVSLRF